MDKRYATCLGIAALLHILGIFFLQLPKIFRGSGEELRKWTTVEYKEEEEKRKIKKKEEEKKLLTPKTPTVSLQDKLKSLFKKEEKIEEEDLKKLAQIARPLEVEKIDAKIALERIDQLSKMQVAINVDEFEQIDLSSAVGDIEVLRIGEGRSTAEILSQDKVVLPEAAVGKGALGLWTTPGVSIAGSGESGVELEKASAEELAKQREEMKKAFKASETTQKVEVSSEGGAKTEIEISEALRARELINSPIPPYPDWAERQGVQGYVKIQITVGNDGRVEGEPMIVMPTGTPLDKYVSDWIKNNWKWKAGGASTRGYIGVRFTLG